MRAGGSTPISHRHPRALPGLAAAFVFLLPLLARAQATPSPQAAGAVRSPSSGPASPAASGQAGSPQTELSISPEEEIKILDAIDAQSNTSGARSSSAAAVSASAASVSQAAAPPANYAPPTAPTGLSVLILKEGVYLSWDATSSGSAVTAYNVLRSTTPGGGYKRVNAKPIPAPYFLDGTQASLAPPRNGEDYFYVVSALDSMGKASPISDEITVTPQGMEMPEEEAAATPTATPEEKEIALPDKNIVNLKLPADTQLSIQGYKKIDVQLGFQNFYNRPIANGIPQEQDTTLVNQELVVNLQGKVGKNVDVNVDYSDVNRAGGVDQSKQEISIKYHGEDNSPIQEVEFGDLQLLLPNTEFAGFSKNLFGLQAKLKFDQFRLTTFFAQTKGISETKVFNGNSVQVDTVVQDITYIPNRYYLITREASIQANGTNGALPAPNSEQIWVDSATGILNPAGPNFGGPQNAFEHWLPGRDYTIDYTTGIITFIRALPSTARIAVGFRNIAGQNRGLNIYSATTFSTNVTLANLSVPDDGIVGVNTSGAHSGFLIKDNNNSVGGTSPTAIALSPLYLVNYFNLGTTKIIPPDQDPDFLFQVISNGTNNVLQTGQGVSQVGASNPWVYNVNLDFNYLTVTNSNFLAPGAPSSFLWPERPFANLDTSGGSSSSNNPSDVYSQTVPPTSLYSIHMRYKTQSSNYSLGRFNIIRGSESVFLDGRRLRRDVDYLFDYTSGFLDFPDKSILRPDSQIVVTYEYAPFGTFGQDNILGARAEYDITDNFFVGSTFLESDAQQPIEVPQIGSTPNSLALFDADSRLDLSQDDVKSLTGVIPGLENWKPPLSVKLSGEVAQSYYNPDTYNAEGESGVAMLDNMEGIDSVTGASMNQTSWLVSAPPVPVGFLPGLSGTTPPDAGADPGNNRVRFYNSGAPNANMVIFQTIGTQNSGSLSYTNVPAYGGHIYAQTGQANDAVQVLQFPYSNLTNQRWGGLRQVVSTTGTDFSNVSYFESWIYNDGNPKWIMVDFGVMNEAANGNTSAGPGSPFFSDPNEYGQPQTVANPQYGLPTFYYQGNPWSPSGSVSAPVNYLINPEQTSQEGVSVGQNTSYVTEDMNGNNTLDPTDAYYEYGIQANWTGWHQVKIPVNFTAPNNLYSTPDGIPYFFQTQGLASPSIIRTVRVWMTGENPNPINGDVYFENISFAHNLWQLQVDPTANVNQGVTVNTAKFDVNSISQDQNPSYQPSLRFLTVEAGQDQSAILFKEKALEVTYNLSSADFEPSGNINGLPIYYTTRIFNQGLDLTDYQDLRLDLYIRSFRTGDVLFVRVGNDQQDYYQYNIQLSAAAVTCLNTWGTVNIPLDGSGGNRQTVGTPFINRATNISIGVVSPNAPSGAVGDLWVNNLRCANSTIRSGVARRANAAFLVGDNPQNPFATINTRYREVDSGFTQIDQTSTHFQHSTQLGGDYASNGVSIFSQPLVTQASYTHQDLYTEAALQDNPYYLSLPDSHIDNATGSISYTKDLGPSFGRLTAVRVSGSTNYEKDQYQDAYLGQPGVLGDTHKGEEIYTVASTYDAPGKLFFIPLGANQFTESYSMTHDYQGYDSNYALANYDRETRAQNYGWTNTTEIVKNLVFTPGYSLSLTDAQGNTNSPGVPVTVASSSATFMQFQERDQPKAGLVYRGIPGLIPSVDYTGSNQYDFVSFTDGTRFTSANNLTYTVNWTPGSWFDFFQKMNFTATYSLTQSATSTIPGYHSGLLNFDQMWYVTPDFTDSLTANQSLSHQINASFKLFDVWDFRPTGTFTNQLSVLSQGSNPVSQYGETFGITTVYNRKIFTLPLAAFTMDSAQVQYTHTDSTQYDSSAQAAIANQTTSDLYSLTLPYDINKNWAQGNFRLQRTTGTQYGISTQDTLVTQLDDQGYFEYDQKLAPNLEVHIPFTHWKIKLENSIELKATFLMEFVNNQSFYINNVLQTDKYRGTLDINYNALKNLRVGIGLANEYFTNYQNPQLDYVLWQGDISAEARF